MPLPLLPLLLLACKIPGGPGELVGTTNIWYRTFGGRETDEGWGIDVTEDGGLVLANLEAHPSTLPDAWVYRTQPDGDIEWSGTWSAIGTEQAFVAKVGGDVVYVGGASYTGLTVDYADAMLLAFDLETGENLWGFTMDGGHGYDEIDGIVVGDDGVYVSGWTQRNAQDLDVLLMKVDFDGNILWQQNWGGTGWDEANGHMVTDGTLLYLVGRYGGVPYGTLITGGQGNLAAFDINTGEPVWNVTFQKEGSSSEDALGLAFDGTTLYTTGFYIDTDPGNYHLIVRAFDLAGTALWDADWTGEGNTVSRSLVVDPSDGSLVVAANTDGLGEPNGDMLFVRVSAEGTMGDAVTWGGDAHEEVHDLVFVDERICANGQTESMGEGRGDAVALCFDPRGWNMPEIAE